MKGLRWGETCGGHGSVQTEYWVELCSLDVEEVD